MRRRGRSPTAQVGTNASAEFLDKDDQDAIVESLEEEAFKQSKQFQFAFHIVAGFAALVALFYPLLCYDACSTQQPKCWLHAFIASATHLGAAYLSEPRRQDQLLLVICAGVIFLTAVLWIGDVFIDTIEHFHVGLLIANIVTFAGALLIRWDIDCMKRALKDLHNAKYEHKSL